MITTETLEEILKDERHRFYSFKFHERMALSNYYHSKFELLERLIEISKEEEK